MRSSRASVVINTVYQLIGRFSQQIYILVLSMIVIRGYGLELWGKYSIFINFLAFFYILSDFGLNQIILRDKSTEDSLSANALRLLLRFRILWGIILMVVAYFALGVLGYFAVFSQQEILLGILLILFYGLSISATLYYQYYLNYKYITQVNISVALISLVLTIVIHTAWGLSFVMLILLAILNLGLQAFFLMQKHVKDFNFFTLTVEKAEWNEFNDLLTGSFWIGLTLFFNSLMFNVDKLILPYFVSISEVGIYSFAYKFFEIFLVIPTFVMGSFYPILIKLKSKKSPEFANMFSSSIFLNVFVWMVCTPVFILFAYIFIPLMWGSDTQISVEILKYLVVFSGIFFITSPLYWLAVLEKKTMQIFWIYVTSAVVNIALNFYFIPVYSLWGAVISTVATESYVLVGLLILLRNYLTKDFASLDGFKKLLKKEI